MSVDNGVLKLAGTVSVRKRLVAYIRVSTIKQLDNTSLGVQLEKIKEYCAFKGHELVEVYKDSESGKNLEREGFEQAIEHVFHGDADGIIVYSLDRFARKALRGWQLIADLEDADKHLVVVNRDLDTTGPTGRLIRNILLSVAEYELALLQERFATGREAKKKSGGYYAGQPRFGWRSVGGRVEAVPSEQWTIKVLTKLKVLGVSSYKCAQYLNRHLDRHATKKGGEWTHRTLERVLDAQKNEDNGYNLLAIESQKAVRCG